MSKEMVRTTPTGNCYHTEECRFIRRYNSKQQGAHKWEPLATAKAKGLHSCYLCEAKAARR